MQLTAQQLAEKFGFVSGHRYSDAASRLLSMAPLGAEVSISNFSAASQAVGMEWNVTQPRRGERTATTQTPPGVRRAVHTVLYHEAVQQFASLGRKNESKGLIILAFVARSEFTFHGFL